MFVWLYIYISIHVIVFWGSLYIRNNPFFKLVSQCRGRKFMLHSGGWSQSGLQCTRLCSPQFSMIQSELAIVKYKVLPIALLGKTCFFLSFFFLAHHIYIYMMKSKEKCLISSKKSIRRIFVVKKIIIKWNKNKLEGCSSPGEHYYIYSTALVINEVVSSSFDPHQQHKKKKNRSSFTRIPSCTHLLSPVSQIGELKRMAVAVFFQIYFLQPQLKRVPSLSSPPW